MNGVKQGGSISPILFHIHIDDLSIAVNNSGIVRYLGDAFLNHLCNIYSIRHEAHGDNMICINLYSKIQCITNNDRKILYELLENIEISKNKITYAHR